jgi:hypothetical protein
MPCVFPPVVRRLPRTRVSVAAALRRTALAGVLAAVAAVAAETAVAAAPAGLAGSGVATAPADAAFLFSSLRLKEQYDAFVQSNAFAAIRELPAVKRAFDSWEEQREMPGSPVSMALTFLELPENEQALELLTDMVATDTFVYGEPSCIAFVTLLRKLSQAQQATIAAEQEFEDEEMDDDEAEEEDDLEARLGGARIVPIARRQVGLRVPGQAEALLDVLADNLDLIAVPDLVWGFKTTKQETGRFQLKRLEVLAKMFTDMNPGFAGAMARKKLPGGELLTFTLDGKLAPWDEIADDLADGLGDSEKLDRVLDRIRGLDLVVGLGIVGDWVVLSIGDSVDHLEKLVLADGTGKALIDTKPLAPLRAAAAEKLTAIWYLSEPLAEALAATPEDLDPMIAAVTAAIDEDGDVPAGAVADGRAWLERAQAEYAAWLPKPGPWLGYSFMTKDGYEGYAWDWAKNLPLDAGRPLDLLAHTGGSPAAVAVSRLKGDPARLAALATLVNDGWGLLAKHVPAAMDDDDREKFAAAEERFAPLARRLAATLTEKLGPALADGQVGLVLDGKTTTKKPQAALPASAEPLPLIEPAIVLPIADRKLFVEGLNDLFELGDDVVAAVRKLDPDAVPEGYEVPAPTKAKVEGGSVWSFPLTEAGLGQEVAPAIAVGDKAAVFSLVPAQAGRMLVSRKLETGAALATFQQPLAAAAAVDFPAVVDAIAPWIVYFTRYGCVQQRDGMVDPGAELSQTDENAEATEALEHVKVVLEVARCLKAAVAETAPRDGATVTHWRNLIRDLPKP